LFDLSVNAAGHQMYVVTFQETVEWETVVEYKNRVKEAGE
jgi:hypothetical protein